LGKFKGKFRKYGEKEADDAARLSPANGKSNPTARIVAGAILEINELKKG
jgi:hypothetical protein